jgi:ABC-2 type transport system permease protein
MSVRAVAEKDFRDAIRSRLMVAVAVLFVLFTGGGVAIGSAIGLAGGDAVGLILTIMLAATGLFVPLIALGVTFRSIAGERDSGSLKLLLSLPNSRLDVVLGKFIGRSAVVTVAIVVGFLAMLLASVVAFDGGFAADIIGVYMLSTLLFGIAFVAIGVSVSSFTKSTFLAAVGSLGLFVVFQYAWSVIIQLLIYVANGFELPGLNEPTPEWAELLLVLSPTNAYSQATRWLVNRVAEGAEAQNTADAFYLEPWFGFVVLALWMVVPLAVGYLRFEGSDL